MALKEIRVDTKTINQITDIIERDPQGHELIQEELKDTINKLWSNICSPKTALILTDETIVEISPKPEYQQMIKQLTGNDGPYTANKTYKSWVGLSEGIYSVENVLIPASWFNAPKKLAAPGKFFYFLTILLVISTLLQSLFLLIFLL